jgi:hypothetical protein
MVSTVTQEALPPIISVGGGDVEVFADVEAAEAYFCFPDAISDELELLDSSGQFLRAHEAGKYRASFELDSTRAPAPDYLAEQLTQWISHTSDRLDYGDLDPDKAELPELIEAVRTARRIGPEPTLWNEIRKIFRRGR